MNDDLHSMGPMGSDLHFHAVPLHDPPTLETALAKPESPTDELYHAIVKLMGACRRMAMNPRTPGAAAIILRNMAGRATAYHEVSNVLGNLLD